MAIITPRTRNLKLFLSSGLTAEARVNLELIDKLGETFASDNTNSLFIRQKQDIHLLPGDPSVGGTAGQGNLFFGSATSPINSLKIFTTNFEVTGSFTLSDISSIGKLQLRYDSSSAAPGPDASPRTITIDVQGANRVWVLGGDLKTSGAITLQGPTIPGASIIPEAGILVTETTNQILTNKTISGFTNTIVGLTQTVFAPGTNLPLSIINGGTVSASQFNSLVGVTSALQPQIDGKQPVGPYITALSGAVTAAGPGTASVVLSPLSVGSGNLQLASVQDQNIAPGISRTKIAAGSALHVVLNDVTGALSSAAFLPPTMGGTGVNGSLVNFPTSGTILTNTNSIAISNKVIDGSLNFITNIPYNSLILTNSITNADVAPLAAISYSKLNLTSGIINADVSASAAISGLKVSPNFGNQLIKSSQGIEITRAGQKTTLVPALPAAGQVADLTFALPPDLGTTGYFLSNTGGGQLVWANPGFGGTVTSVGLTAPVEFTVINSPITTAGNLSLNWAPVVAKAVLCGPIAGGATAPSFRALTATDLPYHTHTTSSIVDFTEDVQDVLGASVQASTSVSWSYNDIAGTLSAAVSLAPFSTSQLAEGSNLYFTAERAQDAVLPAIIASPDLAVVYNDPANTATAIVQPGIILAKPTVTPALADSILFSDASNSGVLSQTTLADVATLIGGGGGSSAGVAFNWTALNGTTRTVAHNLGTRDVLVQLYDNTTGEDIYVDSLVRVDTMTVTLTASEAPSTSWRILIKPL